MGELALRAPFPGISPVSPGTNSPRPEKARDAAQQFEAMLLGQILSSARPDKNGWLSGEEDSSGGYLTDFAEQQLGAVLAKRGCLGIAGLIDGALAAKDGASGEPR